MATQSSWPIAAIGGEPAPRTGRWQLPAGWPLLAILMLFPLWYLLGLGGFIWVDVPAH